MTAHYGEDVRSWPGGCPCHGQGPGYLMDYSSMFEHGLRALGPFGRGTTYGYVKPAGDVGEVWRWEYGYFTWTPYGDLWTRAGAGIAPTEVRANAELERAAAVFTARHPRPATTT